MAGNGSVFFGFIFIAFGGLLFGYIIGINSNIVTTGQVICPTGWTGDVGDWTSVGYNQCWKLSDLQTGLLSSLNLIGAMTSSLITFRFADDMGRKIEVQIGAALYTIGALTAGLSPCLWGMFVGFYVYGLGIGFAMHAAPVYIAEISPAAIRGSLVSAKEGIIVLGMFMGFFFGFLFSHIDTYGWRYMVLIGAVFGLIMEVGIAFVPQSPRFLVLKAARSGVGLLGENDIMREARTALQYFRGDASSEEIESELQGIYADAQASVNAGMTKFTDAFRYPKQLFIGCGIVFLQQVTGQPSVLYFATNIFKSAGFGGSAGALSSTGVGLMKLIATLFTVWRVDQYGRRFLLFCGISMMAVALVVLAVAFSHQYCELPNLSVRDCPKDSLTLPQGWAMSTVFALCVYVSGYQVGFGPIAWLLISEVFPLGVRGSALSLAAITNFASNIMMTLTLTTVTSALTACGNYTMYTVLCFVSLAFVQFVVPETKGRTLEQIEEDLGGGARNAREVQQGNTMAVVKPNDA